MQTVQELVTDAVPKTSQANTPQSASRVLGEHWHCPSQWLTGSQGQREQTAAHPHDADAWPLPHLCTCSGAENLNLIPNDTTWLDLVTISYQPSSAVDTYFLGSEAWGKLFDLRHFSAFMRTGEQYLPTHKGYFQGLNETAPLSSEQKAGKEYMF